MCGKAARAALGNLGEHVSRDRAHVMATRTSTAPASSIARRACARKNGLRCGFRLSTRIAPEARSTASL